MICEECARQFNPDNCPEHVTIHFDGPTMDRAGRVVTDAIAPADFTVSFCCKRCHDVTLHRGRLRDGQMFAALDSDIYRCATVVFR